MMSRMLGAPLRGSTRAGQYGFDSAALRLITPPNFCGRGGSCAPSMLVAAAGEPGGGAACGCAPAGYRARPVNNDAATAMTVTPRSIIRLRKRMTRLPRQVFVHVHPNARVEELLAHLVPRIVDRRDDGASPAPGGACVCPPDVVTRSIR